MEKGRGISFPFIRVRGMTEGGRETRVEEGMRDVRDIRDIREGFIKGPISLGVRGEDPIQAGGVGVGPVFEEGVGVLDHLLQVEKI